MSKIKVVIVGGGTAGWLTAAIYGQITYLNDYDITVIESSKIPIIGAGEGSTGSLPMIIKDELWPKGWVSELDFLRKSKATLKLGIHYKNWDGNNSSFYSTITSSAFIRAMVDANLFASILKYGRGDRASIASWLMENGISTYNKQYKLGIPVQVAHGYHFDGVEVGKYFKNISQRYGVKCIDSEVIDTTFDENEFLKSIKLSNGQVVDGDLFFDCSGFSRVLMSKTKNKWISYKDNLPNNSALTFSDTINSRTVKFETLSETMNSGWMWKIPLQQRHGCGYVRCDDFQNYDKSVEEIEKKLGYSIEPIKDIKFEAGKLEKTWYNNIVAIGLSSNFLEPLQATNIHISILSLQTFIGCFSKTKEDIYSECVRNKYNTYMTKLIEDYRDLVQMHYMAGRNDTPYWKTIKNELKITDKNKEYLEISKYRTLTLLDVEHMHGTAGWSVWSHIFDICGLFKRDLVLKDIKRAGQESLSIATLKNVEKEFNKLKPTLLTNEELFKYLKL
jgi:tryptophan halogenase